MDFLDTIKNFLNSLYSNRIFKTIFMFLFLLFILYYYGNLKDKINNENFNEIKKSIQKINSVQNISNTILIEKKRKEENIKKANVVEKDFSEPIQKVLAIDVKEKEKLKNEFKIKKNKTGTKVEKNNLVKVKMIVLTKDKTENYIGQPTIISVLANNNLNNPFGKVILGQRLGDVVELKFEEIMKASYNSEQKEIPAMLKNMTYRLKIMSIKSSINEN